MQKLRQSLGSCGALLGREDYVVLRLRCTTSPLLINVVSQWVSFQRADSCKFAARPRRIATKVVLQRTTHPIMRRSLTIW